MKRIIDGKTYNTETATKIAEAPFDEQFPVDYEHLYHTRHGAFFKTYGSVLGYNGEYIEDVKPITPVEAQSWLEKFQMVDTLEKLFGEQPEAGEAESRITVRIPDSLKARIERLAVANNQSLNAWITRCFETCANAQTQER